MRLAPLLLAAALAACKAGPRAAAGFETFKSPGGAFSVEVPAAWTRADLRAGGPEQLLLFSPPALGPAAASLWLRSYAAGDPVYAGAAAYAAAQAAPGPGREVQSEKRSEGGRAFQVFRVSRPAARSPESAGAPARVFELQALLDTGSGFVVLGASRPLGDPYWDAHAAELEADFERLLASFRSPAAP